jgi:hypothetical protein
MPVIEMSIFVPKLALLPPPQRQLWPELDATPRQFTLYGGTALALRLGHRESVDFDFFSRQPFEPNQLAETIPYLRGAERVQIAPNTLTCRVERNGPVLVSFFGGLNLGQVAPPDQAAATTLFVASLLDLAGTKVAVVQQRAENKDYLDIDALLQNGVTLPTALAAGQIVYGSRFNPVITLKALSYFDDLPTLPAAVKARLSAAAARVDLNQLPVLSPCPSRHPHHGSQS